MGSITNIDKNSANNDFIVFKTQNNKIAVQYISDLNETISISNAMGQILLNQKLKSNYTEIETQFNPGVYFVTLQANGQTKTSKIIIN